MIYILTKGYYSDYSIIGATTDYEEAKKMQIELNWGVDGSEDLDYVNIETFPDFKEGKILENISEEENYYDVVFNIKNNEARFHSHRNLAKEKDDNDNYFYWGRQSLLEDFMIQNSTKATMNYNKKIGQLYISSIKAPNEEKAMKIAQDMYYQWKYKKEMGE